MSRVPVRMRKPVTAARRQLPALGRESGQQALLVRAARCRTVICARAIGIVEIQHLGLRERIRRAEARRMMRIALDLDRPAHLCVDDDADGVAVQHDWRVA